MLGSADQRILINISSRGPDRPRHLAQPTEGSRHWPVDQVDSSTMILLFTKLGPYFCFWLCSHCLVFFFKGKSIKILLFYQNILWNHFGGFQDGYYLREQFLSNNITFVNPSFSSSRLITLLKTVLIIRCSSSIIVHQQSESNSPPNLSYYKEYFIHIIKFFSGLNPPNHYYMRFYVWLYFSPQD